MNKEQLGFTLIELMISLTLGLIIMLTATQLFITNHIGFTLQRSMGDVQENGRFALDYMSSSIRNSGYNNEAINGLILPAIILDTSTLPTATTNPDEKISCNDCFNLAIGGDVVSSDQLVVRQALNIDAGDFRDCEGNIITPSNNGSKRFIVTRYFVRADVSSNSAAALVCDAGYYNEGEASITNFGDGGVVLLSNIDSFQVQYGIAPNDLDRSPVRYINLATYNALAAPRPLISAVRLAVLVRSADKVTSLLPATQDISVLDYSINKNILTDKYVRRLFSTTLALRNVM